MVSHRAVEEITLAKLLVTETFPCRLVQSKFSTSREQSSAPNGTAVVHCRNCACLCRSNGWHRPAWLPYNADARSDIGLFVELLVFGALAFALLLIPLMRSIWEDHLKVDGSCSGDDRSCTADESPAVGPALCDSADADNGGMSHPLISPAGGMSCQERQHGKVHAQSHTELCVHGIQLLVLWSGGDIQSPSGSLWHNCCDARW